MKNPHDENYQNCLQEIMDFGTDKDDRTGVGTRSVFGMQQRYELKYGFPAVTVKKLAWKAVVGELLWFLEGSTDERRLAELTFGKNRKELIGKQTIWTANADVQGKQLKYRNTDTHKELGPVYGYQWRKWDYYEYHGNDEYSIIHKDQILNLIHDIKTNPNSRRLILSAWNVVDIPYMSLPPCHVMSQFMVIDGKLSCLMYQRSMDAGLGQSFNVASYALLTHLIARECNLEVGDFVHSIGDAHVYKNHFDGIKEILSREPYPAPTLRIDDDFDLMDRLNNGFQLDDVNSFHLDNYQSHPAVKMEMAV